MEPVNNTTNQTEHESTMDTTIETVQHPSDKIQTISTQAIDMQKANIQSENIQFENKTPILPFMGIGSLIYAFFYTLLLYKNNSGITYPFFVGGSCFFFFYYLKKSGAAAKKFSVFLTVSLILLGISTCLTDSWVLLFFNKLGIFLLFFYMVLHNLYQDKGWDLTKYLGSIINITFTSVVFIFRPFTDLSDYLKSRKQQSKKEDGKGKYVIWGILIALPLLLVITLLLCYADAVFSNIIDYLFSDIIRFLFEGNIWGIAALFLFAFFASYCLLCRFSHHNIREEVTDKRTAEPIVGITFTSLISLVYLVFCFIQVVYLFGGLGTLPENYTYARYAREGFFQLVFVCIINLMLVLICNKRFRENKILKGILIFISLCTYIMIASSAYRMVLYVNAYHLTFLRLLVLWGLIVIFLLISGTLMLIFRKSFPMVKYCVITVTAMYLIFSFAHPDYWIARYNLSHVTLENLDSTEDTWQFARSYSDFYYLRNLSLDAAPAIYDLVDEIEIDFENPDNIKWLQRYNEKIMRKGWSIKNENSLSQEHSIRKFNFSRWIAYKSYIKYYNEHGEF